MANNLPRIPVQHDWVDLNTESGIAVGTAIKVQHVGGSSCDIVLSAVEPTIDIGEVIEPFKFVGVSSGETGTLWARARAISGSANLSVQDDT